MVVVNLLRKIRQVGRVAEPAPRRPAALSCPKAAALRGSLQVRHVDAGYSRAEEVAEARRNGQQHAVLERARREQCAPQLECVERVAAGRDRLGVRAGV